MQETSGRVMSYILDAMNKSEQERERRQTPSLKSLRGEPLPNRFQLRHFLYMLALLAIFNSIVVFIYFGNHSQPEVGIEPQRKNSPADSLAAANAARDGMFTKFSSTTAAQSADLPAQITSGNTVAVNDLPNHLIPQLPDMQITAHIFASDPDLRMVNINGVPIKEGDLVSNALILVEITESGVVMDFEGYAYVMNIVENWQNNP
jgi:general secretion pathway protein B